MGIIELFFDVHKIRLDTEKILEETVKQGEQLDTLISLSEETNKKLDVLVVLALKLAKVLAPDEEEVVGISVTPGPVTERGKTTLTPTPTPTPTS